MLSEKNKEVAREVLKGMPIWENFDKFDAQLKIIEHGAKVLGDDIDTLVDKANKLPKLNLTGEPRHPDKPRCQSDLDIVKIYQKQSDGEWVEKKTDPTESKLPSEQISDRSESIRKLEQKFNHNEEVYAMVEDGKPWRKCQIVSIYRRPGQYTRGITTTFKLKNGNKVYRVGKFLVARIQYHGDQLGPTKRVIAGKHDSLLPGIIGFEPNSKDHRDRYMIFLDDGSVKYFRQNQVYPIVGQTAMPWEDIRKTNASNMYLIPYLRYFFSQWPKRNLIQVQEGVGLDLVDGDHYVKTRVIGFDCDIMRLFRLTEEKEVSIYRGDARLLMRSHLKAAQLRNLDINNFHHKIVIFLDVYRKTSINALDEAYLEFFEKVEPKTIVCKHTGQTARKSTGTIGPQPTIIVNNDSVSVDVNTNIIENLNTDSMRQHRCSPDCLDIPEKKTETSVKDLIDEFRHVGDLKVPLMLGWRRYLAKLPKSKNTNPNKITVVYEAPCGKTFQQIHTIRRYLFNTKSKFDIDYFSFDKDIVFNHKHGECKAFYYVKNIAVNPKTGKPLENKFISLVNKFNEQRLPIDFEYRAETFPHPMLKSRGFSFNHEFKSSCDCNDDCSQRSVCPCHRLNEEAHGANAHNKGSTDYRCQYNHKRLIHQVNTGIFECNTFCSCSSICSNRVVQNGIRFRLQVEYTLQKGWGVITLDDIPSGAFICTYSAELLDDADQYGDSDMYYADLDYITVNEEQKGQYDDADDDDEGLESADEEDPQRIRRRKQRNENIIDEEDMDSQSSSSLEVEEIQPPTEQSAASSRYPKRKSKPAPSGPPRIPRNDPRDPESEKSRFKKIHDLLGLPARMDYTLDARMQGNIGRFFNHSCDPNAFVQNVFIETHDLRLPVVAFFAHRTIKAFEEIHWNYNYKMGSIEGRRIDCHCRASNCRGRIL